MLKINGWLACCACLLILATVESAHAKPPVLNMEALYSNRVMVESSGQPWVLIGLATGLQRVLLKSIGVLTLDYTEEGIHKRTVLPPHTPLTVILSVGYAAAMQDYVDIESYAWRTKEQTEQRLAFWHAQKIPASLLEVGTVLGLVDHVLDNRNQRVIAAAKNAKQARQQATALTTRYGVHAVAAQRMGKLPSGKILLQQDLQHLAEATDLVHISTDKSAYIEIADVEYGQGYAWHGFANRQFRGDIYIAVDPTGRLAVVNHLLSEDILLGVVPAEMFVTAPTEALKAQAVAARNTLLAKLGKRHQQEPFHLCSEQHCQVYAGASQEHPRTTAAVQATTGQVLFFGSQIVDAVYSSNCGGHTENNEAIWSETKNLALRGRPDTQLAEFSHGVDANNIETYVHTPILSFCGQSSHTQKERYRWQKTFRAQEIAQLLQATNVPISHLQRLDILSRGVGGRVTNLRLVGKNQQVEIKQELNIRKLFGNLNSAAFTVETEYDRSGVLQAVTFIGAGWGHGVGLCQIGAMGRAEAGHTYQQILGHYYNEAHLEKLYDLAQ